MMDPKEVMMHLEDEMCVEFEEIHGREPTPTEASKIAELAYSGIGEYYADLGDRARDRAKDAS